MKKIVYPGSFDPITIGHLDLIERSSRLYEEVIILVTQNNSKINFFPLEKRVEMIKLSTSHLKNITIDTHDGMLVDYLKQKDLSLVLRGLRTVTDYHYEMQMALNNWRLYPNIEIIFLLTNNNYSFISSSIVREFILLGSELDGTVPPPIINYIKQEMLGKG